MNLIQHLGKFSSASENGIVANLVKKLLSDYHKKLSDQKSRKLDSKYTSLTAKIESRGKRLCQH